MVAPDEPVPFVQQIIPKPAAGLVRFPGQASERIKEIALKDDPKVFAIFFFEDSQPELQLDDLFMDVRDYYTYYTHITMLPQLDKTVKVVYSGGMAIPDKYLNVALHLTHNYPTLFRADAFENGIVVHLLRPCSVPHSVVFIESLDFFKKSKLSISPMLDSGIICIR
jgi:CheY-like chemotaxis protein